MKGKISPTLNRILQSRLPSLTIKAVVDGDLTFGLLTITPQLQKPLLDYLSAQTPTIPYALDQLPIVDVALKKEQVQALRSWCNQHHVESHFYSTQPSRADGALRDSAHRPSQPKERG